MLPVSVYDYTKWFYFIFIDMGAIEMFIVIMITTSNTIHVVGQLQQIQPSIKLCHTMFVSDTVKLSTLTTAPTTRYRRYNATRVTTRSAMGTRQAWRAVIKVNSSKPASLMSRVRGHAL